MFHFSFTVTDQSTAARGVENTERTANCKTTAVDSQLAAFHCGRSGMC